MDIEKIREKIRLGHYEISKHAEIERRKDGLEIKDIKTSIFKGKIIESYPDDSRNPCCLISGFDENGIPIHSLCALLRNGGIRICTVYIPDNNKWINYQIRKR